MIVIDEGFTAIAMPTAQHSDKYFPAVDMTESFFYPVDTAPFVALSNLEACSKNNLAFSKLIITLGCVAID